MGYQKNHIHQELLHKNPPIPSYDDVTWSDGLIDLKYFPRKIIIHPPQPLSSIYLLTPENLLEEDDETPEDWDDWNDWSEDPEDWDDWND